MGRDENIYELFEGAKIEGDSSRGRQDRQDRQQERQDRAQERQVRQIVVHCVFLSVHCGILRFFAAYCGRTGRQSARCGDSDVLRDSAG